MWRSRTAATFTTNSVILSLQMLYNCYYTFSMIIWLYSMAWPGPVIGPDRESPDYPPGPIRTNYCIKRGRDCRLFIFNGTSRKISFCYTSLLLRPQFKARTGNDNYINDILIFNPAISGHYLAAWSWTTYRRLSFLSLHLLVVIGTRCNYGVGPLGTASTCELQFFALCGWVGSNDSCLLTTLSLTDNSNYCYDTIPQR